MSRESLRREAQQYLDLPYSVEVSMDRSVGGNPTYVARIREFAGCLAQGDSASAAVREVKEALVDYVTTLLEDGLPVPSPQTTVTSTSHVEVSVWSEKPARLPVKSQTVDGEPGPVAGATVSLVHA